MCQDKQIRDARAMYSGSISEMTIYFEIHNRKYTRTILLSEHLLLRLTDCLLRSPPTTTNCPVC